MSTISVAHDLTGLTDNLESGSRRDNKQKDPLQQIQKHLFSKYTPFPERHPKPTLRCQRVQRHSQACFEVLSDNDLPKIANTSYAPSKCRRNFLNTFSQRLLDAPAQGATKLAQHVTLPSASEQMFEISGGRSLENIGLRKASGLETR